MKSSSLGRYALSGGVAVALLAGCGALPLSSSKGQDDMQLPVTARGAAPGLRNTVSGSQTFNYSGKKQLFVVPAGVTKITVVARGASGNELGTACTGTAGGGGGGGGYYGGGGGEGAVGYWGGGGGSSYVERSATDVHFWDGWKNATGNGLVVFSW
ncbi:MAG: hypothetical protein WAK16_11965 [Candidatus Cybelea sp.]